jgi:glycosyltransferase involved in cell wall biosynthesis
VTLIAPDGAYGGPARVAVNQASALTDLGHEVTIAAGQINYENPPRELEGAAAQLFPSRFLIPGVGYAGVFAPTMWSWLAHNAHRFDIAHIHLARDLVTIPAAFRLDKSGVPFVVQTHGMVVPRSHPLATSVDRLLTARLLRRAALVFYLNDRERSDLESIGGADLALDELDNGTPLPSDEWLAKETQTDDDPVPEVLYFARLHERKRPEVFAEAAIRLLRQGVRAKFSIVGPPAGAEDAVDRLIQCARREGISASQLSREPGVPPDQALERISRAGVYVLPALREPFGMTIIEALTLRIPVVICRDGGLASFVEEHECGLVVDGSVESVEQAITTLLDDPGLARLMGDRGRAAVRDELNIERVGRELEKVYASVLNTDRGAR